MWVTPGYGRVTEECIERVPDEVWTSPITYVASANCARYCGASVDFVDIDFDTINIDPDKIEAAITPLEMAQSKAPDGDTARLLAEALGPGRLNLLHVDNGLMRKNESAAVVEMFTELGLGENFHFIDATDRFLGAMEGMTEPEQKRRAIGDTFIDVFESEARRLGIEDHLLGQGGGGRVEHLGPGQDPSDRGCDEGEGEVPVDHGGNPRQDLRSGRARRGHHPRRGRRWPATRR